MEISWTSGERRKKFVQLFSPNFLSDFFNFQSTFSSSCSFYFTGCFVLFGKRVHSQKKKVSLVLSYFKSHLILVLIVHFKLYVRKRKVCFVLCCLVWKMSNELHVREDFALDIWMIREVSVKGVVHVEKYFLLFIAHVRSRFPYMIGGTGVWCDSTQDRMHVRQAFKAV